MQSFLCQFLFSITFRAQLRAPLSPLQTAWTGFHPYLFSGGSSSAGPALVEIATARSFILNRDIVTDTMSATPLEPGWWAVLTTALVKRNALHTILAPGVPLLSIKDLAVAISTRVGPA